MKKWMKISIICIVIIINVLLAYQPHFSYEYPILTDEYNHIAFAKYIINEHKLPFTNPYLAYPEKSTNLESGFHFFLAVIFSIIPGEPVLYYKYFIIIFMVINSLLLFNLTFLWFKNYYISLLSMLFYGTIKSTGDLLVHNYFLPLTMGISLLLILFVFFYKWENSKINNVLNKYLIYLIVTLIITILVYPPTLTFFAGVLFLYMIFMKHDIHEKFNIKKKAFFIYFIFIFSIIIIISLTVITYFSLTNYFIFPDTWTPIKAKYSPIFFFGAISSIFAFFGLISTIKYKNSIILPWFIFSLIQIYLYYILKFNILVPFARLFVFYLIGMSILAGIGVVYIYGNISDYSKKVKYFKNLKYVKIIAILLILTFILINYFLIIKNPLNPPHIINENNYEIFDIIKQNNRSETLVIADGLTSTAIYPLTGSKVMGIIGANLGGGFPERNNDFIYGSCEEKEKGVVDTKNALKKINSTQIKQAILVSNFQQKCPFLEQIYEKDSYLYRINLTD